MFLICSCSAAPPSDRCPLLMVGWMDKCVVRYRAADWREAQRLCSQVYSGGRIIELDNPKYHSNESVSVLGNSPIWIGARRDEVWYWSLYPQIILLHHIIRLYCCHHIVT